MPTATSSKTNTAVAALAALGLSAAAGFAYWGAQNWDTFNSDYYKDGYFQEVNQEQVAYNEEKKDEFYSEVSALEFTSTTDDGTDGMIPVTPGYRIPADIVPGYRMPGEMPSAAMEEPTKPASAPEPAFVAPEPEEDWQKKKELMMNSAANQPQATEEPVNIPQEKKPDTVFVAPQQEIPNPPMDSTDKKKY